MPATSASQDLWEAIEVGAAYLRRVMERGGGAAEEVGVLVDRLAVAPLRTPSRVAGEVERAGTGLDQDLVVFAARLLGRLAETWSVRPDRSVTAPEGAGALIASWDQIKRPHAMLAALAAWDPEAAWIVRRSVRHGPPSRGGSLRTALARRRVGLPS